MAFRAVIDRDKGQPWPDTGLSTQQWMDDVKVRVVRITELVATQPHVLLTALGHGQPIPMHGVFDAFPHVIVWEGVQYLEDGHHRAVRTLMRGSTWMNARVLDLDDPTTSLKVLGTANGAATTAATGSSSARSRGSAKNATKGRSKR